MAASQRKKAPNFTELALSSVLKGRGRKGAKPPRKGTSAVDLLLPAHPSPTVKCKFCVQLLYHQQLFKTSVLDTTCLRAYLLPPSHASQGISHPHISGHIFSSSFCTCTSVWHTWPTLESANAITTTSSTECIHIANCTWKYLFVQDVVDILSRVLPLLTISV